MAATLTFIGSTHDGSDASSYTFSGVSIGAAASDRLVIAVVTATGSPTSNANVARTAFTINGSAATVVASGKATYSNIDVGVLLVPAGTTADVSITYDDTKQRATCDIYTLTGASGPAAYDSDADSDETSGTTGTVTLDIPTDGVALFATSAPGTTATVSWSSATEDYDAAVGGEATTTRAGAHKSGPAASHTETATYAASKAARFTVGVSWAPTVTATAAITLGAVTSSATGAVQVKGAAASSLGAVTLSGAGAVLAKGAADVTIGPVTASAAGTVVGNDLNVTLDPVTLSATGAVPAKGDAAITIGPVSIDAAGAAPIAGQASPVLGEIGLAGAGAVQVKGSASPAPGEVGLAATAQALVKGELAATLGAVVLDAAGGNSIPVVTPAERTIAFPIALLAARTLPFATSRLSGRTLNLE